MNLESIKFRGAFTFISLLLFFFLSLSGYSYTNGITLFCSMFSVSALLIFRAYKHENKFLLLIFIYIMLYVYVLKDLFLFEKDIFMYTNFYEKKFYHKTATLFFLFLICLNYFIKIQKSTNESKINPLNNSIIYWICIIIAIYCMLEGKKGENMFESMGYGSSRALQRSSLNEYFFIPAVSALFFSKGTAWKKYLLYSLFGIYALRNLAFGGRIECVMAILCVFLWDFQYKFSRRRVIVITLLGFYTMSIFTTIRENPGLINSGEWLTILIPAPNSTNADVLVSQEGDVFYASLRMIAMADEGIMIASERLEALSYFVLSIFVPYSQIPPIANLASYMSSSYPVGGGGMPFAYFYVFLSYFGVILIAYIIARVLSLQNKKTNNYSFLNLYSFFILVTLPRWFAYNPIVLFKLSLYGAIILYSLIYFHNISKRKNTPRKNKLNY